MRFIGFVTLLSDDKHLCPVDMHNEEENPGTEGIMDAESEVDGVYRPVKADTVNKVTHK